MNFKISLLMIFFCSLQLRGMEDKLENEMLVCKPSKVQKKLTPELLEKDPVRYGNAAQDSSCSSEMTKLLLEVWRTKHPENGLKTNSFAYAYNTQMNEMVPSSECGQNHFLNKLNSRLKSQEELIWVISSIKN